MKDFDTNDKQNSISSYKIPSQSRDDIVPYKKQPDIESYKNTLSECFKEAKTLEDKRKVLEMRKEIQEQEKRDAELEYAKNCAYARLQEANTQANYSRGQQVVASTAAIGIGIYFMPRIPLLGTFWLILGLAKPLGYSLSEISKLLDKLRGLTDMSSDIIPTKKDAQNQLKGGKNESDSTI